MKVQCQLFILLIILVVTQTAVASASKDRFAAGSMATGAPAELMHWGKMVGRWSTTEERLKSDGSGWQASKGADWDFLWAYGGWGIQDIYTSPPMSETLADESTRQRGINLRIYNAKEKKWILTWLTTGSSEPQNMTATSTDEQIIMLTDDKDARGNYGRITFFEITASSFEWKLEWSKDQQSWLEVYRIHGTKKAA